VSTFAELKADAKKYALSSNDTDAGRFVNDVYRELAYLGSQSITRSNFTMTAAASSYDVTAAPFSISNLLALREVMFGSASNTTWQLPIPEESMATILNRLSYTPSGGIPQAYAFDGDRTLYLDTIASIGDVIRLHYVAVPTDMSAAADTPAGIPSMYHRVLADGAAMLLAREEDQALADTLEARYDRGRDKFLAWVNRKTGSRSARITAGYPGRRLGLPHDRSQDIGSMY
jgi:hypothetical protein